MASKNTELKREQEEAKNKEQEALLKAFIDDIAEVEKKHGKALKPIIRQQPDGGLTPQMVAVNIIQPKQD